MVLSNERSKEVVSKKKNIRSLSYKNGVALLKRNEFIKLLLLIKQDSSYKCNFLIKHIIRCFKIKSFS